MKEYAPLKLEEFFAPGVNKNDFTIPSVATIPATKGLNDVYFVFVNERVEKDASLFPLAEIRLLND